MTNVSVQGPSDSESTAPLRLLLVDSMEFDEQLIASTLSRAGIDFDLRRVETADCFAMAMRDSNDLILSVVELPQFGAAEALDMLRQRQDDVPLILVTASHDEDRAAYLLRRGAVDYVLKDRLGRLPQAVHLAIERTRMLQRLSQKRHNMAQLSQQLVQAQELERSSLARELHDELGQRLTALNMQLYRLRPAPSSALLPVWQDVSQGVGELVAQVRDLSITLRPPELDYVGLKAAVRHLLARRFAELWEGHVFEYVGLPARLSPLMEITCYRLVQESLTNIARHARATHVVIEMIGLGEEIDIIIRDDGAGFDVEAWEHALATRPSGGVVGMRERVRLMGGTLTIRSDPGRGTRVAATLPLLLEES